MQKALAHTHALLFTCVFIMSAHTARSSEKNDSEITRVHSSSLVTYALFDAEGNSLVGTYFFQGPVAPQIRCSYIPHNGPRFPVEENVFHRLQEAYEQQEQQKGSVQSEQNEK